jgi:integrase
MGRTSQRIESNVYKVLHKGRWRFRVQIQDGGQRRQRLCASLREAQRLKGLWFAGFDVPTQAPPTPEQAIATVADGLRHYELDLRRRGKDPERSAQVRTGLRRTWPELLEMPVESVAVEHLVEYRQRREREGRRANTIVRDMRVLRAMLKKARPDFVLPVTAMPAEDLTRIRWMTPADEALAFTLVGEPFRGMTRLAALTLMRLSEIRTLHRSNVHLHQRLVLLPRAKGGPRAVFLNEEAAALLERQLGGHRHDLVFPNPKGRAYSRMHVSRVWRRAARAAGLVDFHFHDLRHHGATVALSHGATTKHLKALGGWKSDKLVDRYAHALDPQLRQISESISRGVQP